MASTTSPGVTAQTPDPVARRRAARRRVVVDEALEHAVVIMEEHGVGALTVSEVARRMGLRPPSLYKYFPSRDAVFDELFARGVAGNSRAVAEAVARLPHGVARIRAGTRATVRWCVDNPALAQLLYWRVVPGFRPSPESFAGSVASMAELRAEFAAAARLGELAPEADSDTAVLLLTVQLSGIVTQQLANQPRVPYESGVFTALTDAAVDLVLAHYHPR